MIRRDSSVSAFAVLIATSVVLVVFTGAGAPTPDVATVVSALLDYDGSACNTTCTICTENPRRHMNTNDATPFAQHVGWTHELCQPTGCAFHNCVIGVTLAPEELDDVVRLLPSIPAVDLVAMDDSQPNLVLDMNRGAVQVLGCQGLALASVELTPVQRRDLASSVQ